MRTCEIDGCEQRHSGRGYCLRHYRIWREKGHPLAPTRRNRRIAPLRPAIDRFNAKVDRQQPEGCWEWTGRKMQQGYGSLAVDGLPVLAHRWSYEHYVGPIPPGLTIDHLCRNRGCVNPTHLEPVDRVENVARGESPSARNSRKTHCHRGHPITAPASFYKAPGTNRRECRICRRLNRALRGGT